MKAYQKDFLLGFKMPVGVSAYMPNAPPDVLLGTTLGVKGSPPQKHAGAKPPVKDPDSKEKKIHTSIDDPSKPVKCRVVTDHAIEVSYKELGNEKELLIYVFLNTIIVNQTNDIYKFAIRDKNQWVLMAWLARIAVKMRPDYIKLSSDDVNQGVDQAYRFFLKVEGQLN